MNTRERIQHIVFKEYLMKHGIDKSKAMPLDKLDMFMEIQLVFVYGLKIETKLCFYNDSSSLKDSYTMYHFEPSPSPLSPGDIKLNSMDYKNTWVVLGK